MTFRIPLVARLGALVIATTGFYTYVGQMVPQKEVYPPQEVELKKDMNTAEMAKVGREIMDGKGLCFTCHTIGKKGALRFPDLEGVDIRARTRESGLTDVDYFAQAMYEPNAYIVDGFNPGMPVINKPPIGLTDDEILCVISYLQSLGGTSTVTMQTRHHYYAAAGGAAAPPAAGAATAPDGASAATPAPAPAPKPAAPAKGAPAKKGHRR
ncbi:MAG TPA: cytochrome c [Patescibacteria group bacterium]|nr:cytochrome c [Patescibacteria group bacterium]